MFYKFAAGIYNSLNVWDWAGVALVLRFEAVDEAGLERIKGDFRRILLAADEGLELPF